MCVCVAFDAITRQCAGVAYCLRCDYAATRRRRLLKYRNIYAIASLTLGGRVLREVFVNSTSIRFFFCFFRFFGSQLLLSRRDDSAHASTIRIGSLVQFIITTTIEKPACARGITITTCYSAQQQRALTDRQFVSHTLVTSTRRGVNALFSVENERRRGRR